MRLKFYLYTIAISCIILSCEDDKKNEKLQKNPKQKIQLTAKDILGNPNYLAISYGGYRKSTRGIQPTVAEIKEDLKILHAMKIKILRTYNVQLAQAETILKAIHELKSENSSFEMYVILGAWIDCKNYCCWKRGNGKVGNKLLCSAIINSQMGVLSSKLKKRK